MGRSTFSVSLLLVMQCLPVSSEAQSVRSGGWVQACPLEAKNDSACFLWSGAARVRWGKMIEPGRDLWDSQSLSLHLGRSGDRKVLKTFQSFRGDTPTAERPLPPFGFQLAAGDREPSTRDLVGGGLAGGLLGLGVGVAVALAFDQAFPRSNDFQVLFDAFALGILGESVGLSVGVHLADQRQGSLGRRTLASVAIGGSGAALALGLGAPVMVVAIPVTQLYVLGGRKVGRSH